jgi:hypothetical protein
MDVMLERPTLDDLLNHPEFTTKVDISAMGCFDLRNIYHRVLADFISEGVYRHYLIEEHGTSVATSPLVFRFRAGVMQAQVLFAQDGGANAGLVVFDREAGGNPTIFMPGRWLMKFRDIQNAEDEAMVEYVKSQAKPPLVNSDPRYSPVDDSDRFAASPLGFRQHRNVDLPRS